MGVTYKVIYYDCKTKTFIFLWPVYASKDRAQQQADSMNAKNKNAKAYVATFRGALRIE